MVRCLGLRYSWALLLSRDKKLVVGLGSVAATGGKNDNILFAFMSSGSAFKKMDELTGMEFVDQTTLPTS